MIEIKSFPNNVDEFVGAKPLMRWFHGRTSGVWGAENNASVSPASENSMEIAVSDGIGWLSDSDGDGIAWWNTQEHDTGTPVKLTVDAADTILNRIDRVVISWETHDYTTLPNISILKGTAAAEAKPPELTNNSVKRQISLAQISVPAGTIKITPMLITDERMDKSVCGIVTENVEIDTSAIQAQFVELLTQMQNSLNDILETVVPDKAISTSKIVDGAVTTVKISENAVVQEYIGNIPQNQWLNIDDAYKIDVTVEGALSERPFLVDIDFTGKDVVESADLLANFGLIFDATCNSTGNISLRALDKPLRDIPIKIIVFKR